MRKRDAVGGGRKDSESALTGPCARRLRSSGRRQGKSDGKARGDYIFQNGSLYQFWGKPSSVQETSVYFSKRFFSFSGQCELGAS